MKHPVEAFSDLLDDFRRHMQLQLSWLDVRQVLLQAEALREQYRACHNGDCDSDCADRLRALALLPEHSAIANELLHAASELDGRLQLIQHLAAKETKCA